MVKGSADDLEKLVMNELDRYAGMLPGSIEAAQKATGKQVVKILKNSAPGKNKKEYARGWKSKTEKTRTGANTVIYNGKKPGLAHLLEFGHPIVSGGRTVGQARAFPHIEPAEKDAERIYEQELTKELENDT